RLPGWLVHLPVTAQQRTVMDAHRGVEAPVPVGFAESETHHHLRGQTRHLENVRIIQFQGRRQRSRVRLVQVTEVAAERGVRKNQQGHPGLSGVLDQRGDALQVEVEVAAELGRNRTDPDRAHPAAAGSRYASGRRSRRWAIDLRAVSSACCTSSSATARPAETPVSARISPPGSTTLALPTNRSDPNCPDWLADSHTI